MTTVTCNMAISLDGFVAGPNQDLDNPFGERVGDRLHRWMFEQPDENAAETARVTDAGAFIMGRNMFGPGRGRWDEDWKGWWGDDPPYKAPVFVLTHHPRDPVPMEGARPSPSSPTASSLRSPRHVELRAVSRSMLRAAPTSYASTCPRN